MIDHETSIGNSPVESIRIVSKALAQAEKLVDSAKWFKRIR